MKFRADVPIWKAADISGEHSRPILEHVLVERGELREDGTYDGLLIAANGWLLAVGACTLDADDVPGIVPARLLRRAAKKAYRRCADEASLVLGESVITFEDGDTAFRSGGRTHPLPAFPDWRKVVPRRQAASERRGASFSIQTRLLRRCFEALGRQHPLVITLGATANTPIVLEVRPPDHNGAPVPPFAVLMPMAITTVWDGAQATPAAEPAGDQKAAEPAAATS